MSAPPSDAPWSLAGKTAIVTGGSRGIGQAIAIHLARKGLDKLAITVLELKKAVAIQADALDPKFASKVISKVLERLDTNAIDILVNNAALTDPTKALPVKDTTLNVFFEIMQANVYAPVSLATALLPHLRRYGGRVINISSILAYQPNADPTMTYGASKSTLQSFTRSFAASYAKKTQATFNSVIVGVTETDAVKDTRDLMPPGSLERQIQDTTAADRLGVPEDIAYIVGFLSSEEGRWVNGAAISANGGNSLVMPTLG
ncbi:hypothetical protein EDB81DRAFT_889118 [Dactylonectria macrodidyma]|uniref:Uncharacterized protein n=1 Tax=Dactylonectria macrodidyma TaxID=307937 RepID=A0A9P9DW40_9HYPO|nr:hypothetical protein EDB81DRAFT_889118 [Dactylonectria macrodidyma]